MNFSKIIILISLLTIAGCQNPLDAPEVKSDELVSIKDQISELNKRIEKINGRVFLLEFDKNFEERKGVAFLTAGSEGYTILKTDIGILTVSIENIVPYANGSKITLNFGNLTSGTIDGLTADLDWGKVDENGRPINEEQKTRKVEFSKSLRSGSWTRSDVNLELIPPTELGFIRLKNVGHRGIKLVTNNQ